MKLTNCEGGGAEGGWGAGGEGGAEWERAVR